MSDTPAENVGAEPVPTSAPQPEPAPTPTVLPMIAVDVVRRSADPIAMVAEQTTLSAERH